MAPNVASFLSMMKLATCVFLEFCRSLAQKTASHYDVSSGSFTGCEVDSKKMGRRASRSSTRSTQTQFLPHNSKHSPTLRWV
jgi:hypothetical protein